ncbi:hypothetical protein P152DRAFT_446998 [Eremomyces bilateralis CBS 781.70]|uniref:Uncharacterized protein n=1 Tax=Eremomyces bilateralis CBS 781.70 TaxID=1392243 RepID=A0A6G1GD38_9PEZI|nr:uncharacterized protein P152DRAFT_446998 [Eremomyces bilateralis CBS 781.70]KAF1816007.1 hypothetical protein P152DRAFT_446998 [Eremomyces bilateralis CBS 781.70]
MAEKIQQLELALGKATEAETPQTKKVQSEATAPKEAAKPETPTKTLARDRNQKLPKPTRFEGDKKKYKVWRAKMQNKIQVDGHLVAHDHVTAIAYICAFLDGEPALFATQWRDRNTASQDTEKFVAFLDSRYRDEHEAERAYS